MMSVDADTWRRRMSYAAMSALVTIALLVVAVLIQRAFFNAPPVHVVTLDPADLGVLCPGQAVSLTNRVTVDMPVVLFFYLSTMDETETFNMLDTQTSFPGRPHPHAGTFTQMLPWTVPDLPPGNYARTLAVRGTDGDENPVMITAKYEIASREDCK
jgi:hypothetical protein